MSGAPLVTVEDGTPVLEEQGEAPQELVFEIADEPVRLINEVEAIDRPGAIQRLVIPRIGIDSAVTQLGITRRDGDPVYETVAHVPGQYRGVNPGEGDNIVVAGHVGTRDNEGVIFSATCTSSSWAT
jgi:sortase (surface protein transpeptidase)